MLVQSYINSETSATVLLKKNHSPNMLIHKNLLFSILGDARRLAPGINHRGLSPAIGISPMFSSAQKRFADK